MYSQFFDFKKAGMWISRPGLGLETDQDHFFEVLVLVLVLVLVSACLVLVFVFVSEGGLEQDLRLCATATLLVSKVETSKWMCSVIYLFIGLPHLAVYNSYLIYTTTLRTYLETRSWSRDRSRPLFWGLGLGLGLGLPGLDNISEKKISDLQSIT